MCIRARVRACRPPPPWIHARPQPLPNPKPSGPARPPRAPRPAVTEKVVLGPQGAHVHVHRIFHGGLGRAAAAAEAGGGCGRAQHSSGARGGLAPRKGRGLPARLYSRLRSRETSPSSRLRARARQHPLPAPAGSRASALAASSALPLLPGSGQYAEGSHEACAIKVPALPLRRLPPVRLRVSPERGARTRTHACFPSGLRGLPPSLFVGLGPACAQQAAHLAKWRQLQTGGDAGCLGTSQGPPVSQQPLLSPSSFSGLVAHPFPCTACPEARAWSSLFQPPQKQAKQMLLGVWEWTTD